MTKAEFTAADAAALKASADQAFYFLGDLRLFLELLNTVANDPGVIRDDVSWQSSIYAMTNVAIIATDHMTEKHFEPLERLSTRLAWAMPEAEPGSEDAPEAKAGTRRTGGKAGDLCHDDQ